MAYRIITIRVLWIREFDKFIFCVCHTRKTVQASGSPMFFLLLKRPPTLGDNTDGVWAAWARAWPRSSELARRRADRDTTDFASRRGRRRGSVAPGAGRRWPAGRSGSRQPPPALPRSSRGDGRTAALPTSASRIGRRRGPAATGASLSSLFRRPGVLGASSRPSRSNLHENPPLM